MKRIVITSLFSLAVIFAAASESYACFCKPWWVGGAKPLRMIIADSKAQAAVVFVGTVVSIRTPDESSDTPARTIYAKLAVQRSWKGPATEFIEVATARDGDMCGVGFEVGKEFIVYASKGETVQFRTSSCSRTQMIVGKSGDERYLGKRRKRGRTITK